MKIRIENIYTEEVKYFTSKEKALVYIENQKEWNKEDFKIEELEPTRWIWLPTLL